MYICVSVYMCVCVIFFVILRDQILPVSLSASWTGRSSYSDPPHTSCSTSSQGQINGTNLLWNQTPETIGQNKSSSL